MSDKTVGGLPPSGFGPELRRVREQKGMTQKEIGDAAGVHPNTIARMERGEAEPSWQMVIAISKALGVDCTAFAGATRSDAEPAPAVEPDEPASKKPKGKK